MQLFYIPARNDRDALCVKGDDMWGECDTHCDIWADLCTTRKANQVRVKMAILYWPLFALQAFHRKELFSTALLPVLRSAPHTTVSTVSPQKQVTSTFQERISASATITNALSIHILLLSYNK